MNDAYIQPVTASSRKAMVPLESERDRFSFAIDTRGAFTSLSPAVYSVLGYWPDELLGRSLMSIAAPDRAFRSSIITYRMLHSKELFEGMEAGLARKGGEAVNAEIGGRPIIKRGNFAGFEGTVRVQRTAVEMVSAAPQAELLLDIVCHDIKNMDQIEMGYLELAMKSLSPGSPAYEHIGKCMAVATSSSDLVRNVQKLLQIGPASRALKRMDIGRILAEAVDQCARLQGKNATINHAPASGYAVMANELLKDAFVNIIDNAIRHTPGSPVVDVVVREIAAADKKAYVVTIDDNGPGIPDEAKGTLFDRFGSGHASINRKGLGLYLVRKVLEGFDGAVWVEDRVPGDFSKGCRFVVALPAATDVK